METLICRNDDCPAYDADNDARQRWEVTMHAELGTGYRGPKNDDDQLCPTCRQPGEVE